VERTLALALAATLSAPLTILEMRRMFRGAWRNTATVLNRADTLARATGWSLASYALFAAPGRLWTLLHRGSGVPPLVEMVALGVAMLAGSVVLWRGRR
jgi:hypothetical protein